MTAEWLVAGATAGLFFVTAALACYTYRLWKATASLVREARETAAKQLRAYVSVKEISMQEASAPEVGLVNNWRVTVILENGGKTPTKNLTSAINSDSFDGTLPEDFAFPDSAHVPALGFIGPGASIHTRHVDVPLPLMEFVGRRLKHVYVWGWVDYDDVVEGASRHRTEFCFELLKDGPLMSYRPYGPFNGADSECHRQPAAYSS